MAATNPLEALALVLLRFHGLSSPVPQAPRSLRCDSRKSKLGIKKSRMPDSETRCGGCDAVGRVDGSVANGRSRGGRIIGASQYCDNAPCDWLLGGVPFSPGAQERGLIFLWVSRRLARAAVGGVSQGRPSVRSGWPLRRLGPGVSWGCPSVRSGWARVWVGFEDSVLSPGPPLQLG